MYAQIMSKYCTLTLDDIEFIEYLFGMSPDVPAFKVRVLTSDFKF